MKGFKKYTRILLIRACMRKSLSTLFLLQNAFIRVKICFSGHIMVRRQTICRSFDTVSFFNNTATALKHREVSILVSINEFIMDREKKRQIIQSLRTTLVQPLPDVSQFIKNIVLSWIKYTPLLV